MSQEHLEDSVIQNTPSTTKDQEKVMNSIKEKLSKIRSIKSRIAEVDKENISNSLNNSSIQNNSFSLSRDFERLIIEKNKVEESICKMVDPSHPKEWYELLSKEISVYKSDQTRNPEKLMALYWEATNKIDKTKYLKDPLYFQIWMGYAKLQSHLGKIEASKTFSWISKSSFGLDKEKGRYLYISWAECEQKRARTSKSFQVLAEGKTKGYIEDADIIELRRKWEEKGLTKTNSSFQEMNGVISSDPLHSPVGVKATPITEKFAPLSYQPELPPSIQHSGSPTSLNVSFSSASSNDSHDGCFTKMNDPPPPSIVPSSVSKSNASLIPSQPLSKIQTNENTNTHEDKSKLPTPTYTLVKSLSSEEEFEVNSNVYIPLECIGKGGSSKVFKVLSRDLHLYALKKVSLENVDSITAESFLNEIELLQKLQHHSNIIKYIDSEVNNQTLYLVMELGEVDLSHLIAREGEKFNENYLRLCWQQMLEAVHTIHEERIVHGDLKPQNFVFVKGTLKLIDFGIAKAIQSDTTNIMRENQIGTINYISPEALIDVNEDPNKQCIKLGRASDIWSLGCILYQMIYGKPPFSALNLFKKLKAITDPNCEIIFPSIKDQLAVDVLKKCLQRNPKARPSIPDLLQHPFLHPSEVIRHYQRLKQQKQQH